MEGESWSQDWGLGSSAAHLQVGILAFLPTLMGWTVVTGAGRQSPPYASLLLLPPIYLYRHICVPPGSVCSFFLTLHTPNGLYYQIRLMTSKYTLLCKSAFPSAYRKSLPQAVTSQGIVNWPPSMLLKLPLLPLVLVSINNTKIHPSQTLEFTLPSLEK